MPAAVAIPAIIGAGASVGGAALQSRAIGKAQKAQEQGARRAEQAQREGYAAQQGLYQNYLGGASNTLGRLMTPGAGARYASAPLPQMGQGPAPQVGTAVPRSGMPVPNMGQGPAPTLRSMQSRPGGGGLVQLRAPDGSVGSVPEHLAEQFIQRGAQRI